MNAGNPAPMATGNFAPFGLRTPDTLPAAAPQSFNVAPAKMGLAVPTLFNGSIPSAMGFGNPLSLQLHLL